MRVDVLCMAGGESDGGGEADEVDDDVRSVKIGLVLLQGCMLGCI